MRKFWTNLPHFLLTFLVLLSIFFSLNIIGPFTNLSSNWSGDEGMEAKTTALTPTQIANPGDKTPLLKVFRPVSLVYSDGEGFWQSREANLLTHFNEKMTQLKVDRLDLDSLKKESLADYIQESHNKEMIELEYADQIPLQLLGLTSDDISGELGQIPINLISYPRDSRMLYLIDREEGLVYSLPLKAPANFDDLKTSIDENKNGFKAVKRVDLKTPYHYLLDDKVEVKALSYILERQSNAAYLQLLFNLPDQVNDYSDVESARYYTENKGLVINNSNFEILFNQTVDYELNTDPLSVILQAYNDLQRIQANNDNWIYSQYNHKEKNVTFRKVVGGIPIYGSNFVSRIRIGFPKDHTLQAKFSALNIQTPLNDLTENFEMQPATSIMKLLEVNHISSKDIDSINIGYYWVPSSKSNRLISLVPCWMIEKDGTYFMLDELVDMTKNEAYVTRNTANDVPVYIKHNRSDQEAQPAEVDSNNEEVFKEMNQAQSR